MSEAKKCFFCNNECDLNETPGHHQLNTYSCNCCGEYILPKQGLYVNGGFNSQVQLRRILFCYPVNFFRS